MDYVIVDTSVWIEYLRGNIASEVGDSLAMLLKEDLVVCTDIIRHELLIGTRKKVEFGDLDQILSSLFYVSLDASSWEQFTRFCFNLKLHGVQGGFADSLIAYLAHENHFPVFSLDKYFDKLARLKFIKLFD